MGHEHELLVEDRLEGDARPPRGRRADDHVHLAGGHRLDELVAHAEADVEPQTARKHLSDPGQDDHRQELRGPGDEHGALPRTGLPDPRVDRLGEGVHGPGDAIGEILAAVGGDHADVGPLEQAAPQPPLQRDDLRGDGRGGHAQLIRRLGNRAVAVHRDESPQRVPRYSVRPTAHVCSPVCSCCLGLRL